MRTLGSRTTRLGVAAGLILAAVALTQCLALAHCDGLDGPVVTAARQALETKDVTKVLIWVHKENEPEIRTAFEQTLAVRKLNAQARDLADRHFFETLVRVHRASEGASYTGLKPAGRDLGPAIPAADRALESSDVEPLVKLLVDATEHGVRHQFAEAQAARSYAAGDVDAGREYIGKYVTFLHYVERLHEAATTAAHGHEAEVGAAEQHQE